MTQVFWVKRGNLRWKPVGGTSASKSEFSKKRARDDTKCSDLKRGNLWWKSARFAHKCSRGHGADENSKSLFGKSRGKGWPNLYRLLRGGSHGNGEKSFLKLCRFVGEIRVENSPICVDFFRIRQSLAPLCFEFLCMAAHSVELVLALRALLRGPWRARRTHTHNTEKKHTHTENKKWKKGGGKRGWTARLLPDLPLSIFLFG